MIIDKFIDYHNYLKSYKKKYNLMIFTFFNHMKRVFF